MDVTIRGAELGDGSAIAACLASLGYDTSAELVGDKLAALTGSAADAVLVAVLPSVGLLAW